jgi:hypothetical protein
MVDDEVLLRERLERLFEQVTPPHAPVDVVLRKGRVMRRAHQVVMGAGLVAGVALVAFVVPGVLRHPAALVTPTQPVVHHDKAPGWPVVTVSRPGPKLAARGVIALGRARGGGWHDTWRVWLDRRTGKAYVVIDGQDVWLVGTISGAERLIGPSALADAVIEAWSGSFGAVRADVTSIRVVLNDHQVLTLHPVTAFGRKWTGLILPLSNFVVRETAYAGSKAVGTAVSYGGGLVSWLRPGQSGPARVRARIGAGVLTGRNRLHWKAWVAAGPWGYCVYIPPPDLIATQRYCLTPAQARSPGVKLAANVGRARFNRWIIGTATPAVATIRLSLAGGKTVFVPTALVSGQRFYALAIARSETVLRWGAYDATGHLLYGGRGGPNAGHVGLPKIVSKRVS